MQTGQARCLACTFHLSVLGQMSSRIQLLAIVANLEMQMGTGGVTGIAHSANHLPTLNRLSLTDIDIAQVRVIGGKAVGMVDHDQVTIAHIGPARKTDKAPVSRQGCTARGGPDVDRPMA